MFNNIPIFTDKRNAVLERCHSDPTTRLRLKLDVYYRCVDRANGAMLTVDGKDMIMMSSNEYLGLSQHPKVIEAAKRALDEWGSSACGSRLANGTRRYHVELEEEIAEFLGKEACHISAAGYLACMSSISSLAQRGDALIVDKSIHSALWDGVNLSAATVERFAHEDMNSLKRLLQELDPAQPKVIVVDGVYSMEGHIASVPELVELAKEFDCFLVVDDAHGFGILGDQGRGTVNHYGLTDEVDVIVGSFSKSLSSVGGFIAGDKAVIEYLRTTCRQIIFSAGIPPASVASARAALKVIQDEPEIHQKLWSNTRYLRRILDDLGVDYWDSPTPAIPIVVGNKDKCFRVWQALWKEGIFSVMSVSPGVPVGKDLIRCAVSALHTKEHLDKFGDALKIAMKKAGLQPKKKAIAA
ncbi:MAG: aminotransferase class I/II-fold pyridoxal phosphate-dependent enzyme [Verrucomicrobiota bacterium]